jgi:hypothetical protein
MLNSGCGQIWIGESSCEVENRDTHSIRRNYIGRFDPCSPNIFGTIVLLPTLDGGIKTGRIYVRDVLHQKCQAGNTTLLV